MTAPLVLRHLLLDFNCEHMVVTVRLQACPDRAKFYGDVGAFREKYHHEPNRGLVVVRNGHQYDSNAIFGAAWATSSPKKGACRD
jgi:hypothetical protein